MVKQGDSIYVQRRSSLWLKRKHRQSAWMAVAGWRPPDRRRLAGLLIADGGHRVGLAAIALPDHERQLLAELLARFGRRHPTGSITLPDDALEAHVRYTGRTPSRGLLREAIAVAVRRPR